MTKDNRHTEEAETVRRKSEFLKRVEDFASYMQKEYIDGSDDRSLIISAGERRFGGDSQGGMCHVMLGPRDMNTAAAACMVREDGFREVFATVIRDGADAAADLDGAIRSGRRRLRTGYGIALLSAFWSGIIIGLQVLGMTDWVTTVTNLLLMAFVGVTLWRAIRPMRAEVARLEERRRRERQAYVQQRMEKLFAETLRRLTGRDGDDEDDD